MKYVFVGLTLTLYEELMRLKPKAVPAMKPFNNLITRLKNKNEV
jgi:hypothetical protein